jgi:hypothetical protein
MRYPDKLEPAYDGDSYTLGWNDAIDETRGLHRQEEVWYYQEIQHLRERNADLAREVQRLLAYHEALQRAMADARALQPMPRIILSREDLERSGIQVRKLPESPQ